MLLARKAEDDVIRSGILEITDKQSVVLLSAIAMAMDLQEDAAPTDKQTLAMEVKFCLFVTAVFEPSTSILFETREY